MNDIYTTLIHKHGLNITECNEFRIAVKYFQNRDYKKYQNLFWRLNANTQAAIHDWRTVNY